MGTASHSESAKLSSVFNLQSSILNPQSVISYASVESRKSENTKTLNFCCLLFCSQKLDLQHFYRECSKNLNIRTLRTKTILIKFAGKDKPQVVQPCIWVIMLIMTIMIMMTMMMIKMTKNSAQPRRSQLLLDHWGFVCTCKRCLSNQNLTGLRL